MVLLQSHHSAFVALLLQKQHRAVTLTPLYVLKLQRHDLLFIIPEHKLFPHCSVVFIQSMLVSKVLIYSHVLSANGPP